MNRRKAIKHLAIVSGGLITLPQWMVSCGISDTNIHHTSFSIAEQKILAGVTDTIIPAGTPIAIGGIGALSMEVDKFLQKLIDDCYEKDVQDKFKTQLNSLDESAKATHKKSFADCTQAQREEFLLRLSNSEDKARQDFFKLIKSETIRGFNTSQKVMQEYLGYKIAPGYYYGSIDVKTSDHA